MSKEVKVEAVETAIVDTKPAESKWKVKVCPVVNYIPSLGILGFTFDKVGCQITVDKNLDIGREVSIKYQGKIGEDIKFKL